MIGAPNSVAAMVGLDIHSEPGIIKVNQRLTKDSPENTLNSVDDFIKTGVACSDGNTYMFGSTNGKVWKRFPGGSYQLVSTVQPPAGSPGITGSAEYQGYIYYAMQNRLGRWQIGTNWTSRNDNFATFLNGSLLYHPMKVLNLILYIGDGNFVAQVDDNFETITYNTLVGTFKPGEIVRVTAGVNVGATAIIDSDNNPTMVIKELSTAFTVGDAIKGDDSLATAIIGAITPAVYAGNALDLPSQYQIKCLGQLGTDLLIGTIIAPNVASTQIFRWNTWSVSYTNSDPIPEVGINSFLPTDNFVIVNAGKKGNLYIYNGSSLEIYKQIPGNWTATNRATVNPEAILNRAGLPLFALSHESGDATTLGIYSLGRTNRNYKYVLNCEYLIHNNHIANVEFGTIISAGDVFLLTYKDSDGTYGVDRLDVDHKFSQASFTTRALIPDRMEFTTFKEIFTGYRVLPDGCKITFEKSINYGAFVAVPDVGIKKDAPRKIVYMNDNVNDATVLQIKVNLVVNQNQAPEVDTTQLSYYVLPKPRLSAAQRPQY